MPTLNKSAVKVIRSKAVRSSEQCTSALMVFASALWDTYYNDIIVDGEQIPLWQFWGYKSWYDYCERELGVHQTTASAYRKIHEVFEIELKGSWDKTLLVSFTKMKALSRVVTKSDVNSWLKKAGKLSCCELEEAITGKASHKQFTVVVTEKELKEINDIIEAANSAAGGPRRAETLLQILGEWKSMSRSGSKSKLKLVKKAA